MGQYSKIEVGESRHEMVNWVARFQAVGHYRYRRKLELNGCTGGSVKPILSISFARILD